MINQLKEEVRNTLKGNTKELYDVLINNEVCAIIFFVEYYEGDIDRISIDLLKFRNYKIDYGVGQSITAKQFENTNDIMLKSLLQSLFQENVNDGDIKAFKKEVEDIAYFIELHRENKYDSFRKILKLYKTKVNNNNLLTNMKYMI